MKYHALPLRPMQESGAFLLRAMQNEDMPRLDLLVRESVQNALDAALDRQPGSEVRIAFHVREHATETVASVLSEGIDRKTLLGRFPAGGKLLEIRDSLTEGLTGPLGFDDIGPDGVHGNLLKLVYEIGRTRNDIDAGGSWGLGKTCYFQMGIGLVFYYSRIRLDNGYQERLVASLVEDETSSDRLQRNTRTGIGWWGAEGALKPVTRAAQMERSLDMLRVRRFTGEETGTSIVIPFLRDDLVPAAASDDDGGTANRPWWCDNYGDYIRIALERWFCARLDNPHFATGPRLSAAVNGKEITASRMQPVFQVAQALYNRAIGAPAGAGDYLMRNTVPADAIMLQPVAPRSLFTTSGPAGDLAAALLTPEQLGMAAPLNHYDPGMCVFGRSDAIPPYRPLVTFMRRPGMCVSWDDSTESRGWAGGQPGVADSRYLVAVFVPRQNRVLVDAGRRTREDIPVTLESYLRGCERADHAAWHDMAGLKVIERIRSNCARILRDFGSRRAPAATVGTAIRMARNLADLVLPERGMGTDGRSGQRSSARTGGTGSGGSKDGGQRRSASAAPILELLNVTYLPDAIQVQWSLEWGSAEPGAVRTISMKVDSESGAISLQQWHEDGLGAFPFRMLDVSIEPVEDGAAGLAVEIDSVESDSVLLRPSGKGAVGTVRGVLRLELPAGRAGALRPVLVADVNDATAEQA